MTKRRAIPAALGGPARDAMTPNAIGSGRPGGIPVARGSDFRAIALYAFAALVVRLLPPSRWAQATRWPRLVTDSRARRLTERYGRYRAGYLAVNGRQRPEEEIRALFNQYVSRGMRSTTLSAAAFRRRHGWDPTITLVGREHFDRAAARGRGVILWFDHFTLSSFVGKRAIAEAGIDMWYVSAYSHGFSAPSRLSASFLSWRAIEVELRYIAGRIVFPDGPAVAQTRRVVEILDRNGVVGIFNNAVLGKTIAVPFAGGARLRLASTPLRLAATKGVALLPVAVIETEPFASYKVRIAPALTPAPGETADPVAALAASYARYLLPVVKAHPDQWNWADLRVPAGEAGAP